MSNTEAAPTQPQHLAAGVDMGDAGLAREVTASLEAVERALEAVEEQVDVLQEEAEEKFSGGLRLANGMWR